MPSHRDTGRCSSAAVRPRISKAAAALVLAVGGVVAMATAAHAQGTQDGCAGGNECFNNGGLVITAQSIGRATSPGGFQEADGILGIGPVDLTEAVNNTDPWYSSEGNFVLQVPGVLCVYVPDSSDEQAPGTVEDPADGASVDAVQFGQTAAEADAIAVVALSSCA